MGARGKATENAWLRRCRAATGWTDEEAHRHDAESRAGEGKVGDFVLPAPVVVQLRAMKSPAPWKALRDAEAAAEGTEKRPVAAIVVKRGGGPGRQQYRLVGVRPPVLRWLQEETGIYVSMLAVEDFGLVTCYELVLEHLEVEPRGMTEHAFRLTKRGSDRAMDVIEESTFHRMLAAGWGRQEAS